MNIVFYPLFTSEDKLNQYVQRTTWYLYPLQKYINRISFLKNFSKGFQPKNIDVLDSNIVKYFNKFEEINIIQADNEKLLQEIKKADFIFVHEEETRNQLNQIKNKLNLKFEVVRVDYERVQYADSFMLRFSERIVGLHKGFRKIAAKKVPQYLQPLKSDKVYLFGTGPNFEYVKGLDYSDGLVIACNSMVINEALINHLNPQLFVIADPIFHAGPSSYAGSFRSSFLKILGERDCPIIVPMRDYHIYSTYFPSEIVDRLIPIEFINSTPEDSKPLFDIFSSLSVRTTSNILTLFQIPLACSLGSEIYIGGCDGRPLSQNNYFWSHNKSVQINEKMEDIKQAHPSFFDISYDDYYNTHISVLDKWLDFAESLGKKVYNITPSYIPALNQRANTTVLERYINKESSEKYSSTELSIIIPLYNAYNYLEEAVESIVVDCKDRINYEVIIIDDFSEDGSYELAKDLSSKNARIKVHQNFYNKGVSGARNTGMKFAKGKAFCFLDADDFVFEDSIYNRFQIVVKEEKIVHSTLVFVNDKGEDLGVEVGVRRNITYRDCAGGNPCSFNTLMFPSFYLDVLKFDVELSNGEDWLAIAKILRTGTESKYVKAGRACYRVHSNSTVMKDVKGHEDKLRKVVDWVHSENTEKNTHDDFKGRIFKVKPSNIFTLRRIGVIITEVLSADDPDFRSLLNNDVIAILNSSTENFANRLRVPFVRAFSVNLSEAKNLSQQDKNRILKNLKSLDYLVSQNYLTPAIKSFIGLQEQPFELPVSQLDNFSLQEANRLFRNKEYNKALTLYERYIEKDNFYDFLKINIELCLSRMNGET